MKEIVAFIEGWESFQREAIAEIEAYSKGWSPNGPSKATAEAIIKKLGRIQAPLPEGDRQ